MGRLPHLIVLVAALAACPEDPPRSEGGARGRSDVVVDESPDPPPPAAADGGAAQANAAADAGHATPVSHRTGPLCADPVEPPRGARPRPETVPTPPGQVLSAAGAPAPRAIDPESQRWSWINLWAAWCIPCREEMPLLRSWMTRLAADGVQADLGLISLDDDERQLRQFLDRATGDLPRASLWIPGGAERTRWLKAVGLRDNPGLPVQILVKPGGALGCIIQGAVEPGDYDAVKNVMVSATSQ
jgi:thiol-disulfide isomerase/thioredoxin